MEQTVIVTGGAGFIGSALVRHLLEATDYRVVNLDKLTYAGHRASIRDIEDHPRHEFVHGDICDEQLIASLFEEEQPCGIFHLAAESHVDRSIDGPSEFVQTNVVGTTNLLEHALEYWNDLDDADRKSFRFLHISTDEVYGELGDDGMFDEETPYDPNNPYAASKASADFFVRSWHHTYGLPILITNCANNYGPRQFPEKLIPVVLMKSLRGDPIPVYGDGTNVRDWIYVNDHVDAIHQVFEDGEPGEDYNIGSRCERQNIELVRTLCGILDDELDDPAVDNHADLITFVEDRPGHDARYAIDPSKVEQEIGWQPATDFETGLRHTVQWYLDNLDWCEEVLDDDNDLVRLGTRRGAS